MKDCLVIGAGFAGLSCARQLHDAGYKVQVVEARDRLGGRTCTTQLAGKTVDIGGQWIGTAHAQLQALAQAAQVSVRDQYCSGDKLLHLGSQHKDKLKRYKGLIPNVNPLSLVELELMIRKINAQQKTLDLSQPWAAVKAIEWDSKTLATWAKQRLHTRSAREIFDIAIRSVMTAEAGALSYLGFLFYCASNESFDFLTTAAGGAQHQVVEGGMVQLAKHLAAPLSEAGLIQLESPVDAVIKTEAGHYEVHSGDQRWQTKRVVCAVPPALQNRIRFDPLLPADRFRLAARMPMGSVIKCVVAYKRPFWREAGLSGEAVSHALPFNTVFDATPLDQSFYALVGFIDGAPAQYWSGQSEESRKAAVIQSLVRYFGEAAAQPMDYAEKDWLTDEWARGCYVGVMPPGLLTELGTALRRPVDGLHWAGTETSERFCGYIEGAILSGQRAANEIAQALNSTS